MRKKLAQYLEEERLKYLEERRDREGLLKFLIEHPRANRTYKTFQGGEQVRTEEQMERAKGLNLLWANKLWEELRV